jgi:hypothetical protein
MNVDKISAAKNFWRLVENRIDELRRAGNAECDAYGACLDALHLVDDRLFIEFSAGSLPYEFIVTADGNRDAFNIVHELVRSAPKMQDWLFLPLKPKLGFPEVTRWENGVIRIEEVYFKILVSDKDARLGLRFYVPAFQDEDRNDIHNALLRACDHGLGEEGFASLVGYTEVVALPPGATSRDFSALSELAGKLEDFHVRRERKRSE